MNSVSKNFILVYGLYLGWILSFTYEGPLFNILINSEQYNIKILVLVMHIVPIILIRLLLLRYVKKFTDNKIILTTIAASLVFSVFFILFGSRISGSVHFSLLIFLSVLTGIAELLFIMGSTSWFIKYVPTKHMFVTMAIIILIANVIVIICNLFILFKLETISIIISVAACLGSLILAVTIDKVPVIQKNHQKIPLPRNTILFMCIAFYLFNIGGGIVFEIIDPLISRVFGLLDILSILPYIITCLIIIIYKRKTETIVNNCSQHAPVLRPTFPKTGVCFEYSALDALLFYGII